MTSIGTVSLLNRYPVKSMQGDTPTEVTLDADGIVGDRTWALRDIETGKLVSAKQPRKWRAMLDCSATGTGDDVVVTLPSGESWGIHDAGLRIGLEALFGRSMSIESASGPGQGEYDSDWPEIEGLTLAGEMSFPMNLTGEGTSFIDLGILHVLTTTSMASLQAADPELAVDVASFRPSILLETPDLEGFPENEWEEQRLLIGDEVELTLGMPAPRCIMTTLAQGDLPRQPGVLQTLSRVNRLTNPLGSFACLGAYANVAQPGTIRTGDAVRFAH